MKKGNRNLLVDRGILLAMLAGAKVVQSDLCDTLNSNYSTIYYTQRFRIDDSKS